MAETRKIAAILVGDVVGYSRLAGSDEDRTLARLRGLRSDLIDPAIAAHHGRIVKPTGDGSIIEFRCVVSPPLTRSWARWTRRTGTWPKPYASIRASPSNGFKSAIRTFPPAPKACARRGFRRSERLPRRKVRGGEAHDGNRYDAR
jgi:class 3 adenylate cyclase